MFATAVVIRFPGHGLVLSEFTARHPLCRVEAAVEGSRLEQGRGFLRVKATLGGVEEAEVKRLVGDLSARYGRVEDVGRETAGWTLRFLVGFDDLRSPAARYLLGFHTEFGKRGSAWSGAR